MRIAITMQALSVIASIETAKVNMPAMNRKRALYSKMYIVEEYHQVIFCNLWILWRGMAPKCLR